MSLERLADALRFLLLHREILALVHLVGFVRKHGFTMLDCQQETAHLASMGACPIPRERFVEELGSLVDAPGIARWPARLLLSSSDHESARMA